jgi:hypothetical protein
MHQTSNNGLREWGSATWPRVLFWSVITALSLATAYAVFVATFRVDLPGLYYDEMLFVPPAFFVLGQCGNFDTISMHLGDCFPILIGPIYLGALKAYLYAPLLAVFSVSPQVIRLPASLLAILTAVLSYRFFVPRLGLIFAALAAVFLLTSPVFLWHARVDWGPFVIAVTCRFLVLAFVIRWLENARPDDLIGAGAAFMAGLFDKLNFAWLLPPLIAATLLVYPREAYGAVKTRWRSILLVVIIFGGLGLVFLIYSILPALRLQIYPRAESLMANANRVMRLLDVTFSGSAQFKFMFTSPFPERTRLGDIFFGQITIGTMLIAILVIFRRKLIVKPALWSVAKLVIFLHVGLLGSIAVLLASPDATGSHHAVFLLPLLAYDAAALLKAVDVIGQLFGRLARRGATAIVVVLALSVIGEQIRVGLPYINALQRNTHAYRPNFTPAIYALAETVAQLPATYVISVDWGTHMQLVSLAPSDRRERYRDYWPFFKDLKLPGRQTNPIMDLVGFGTNAVFVEKPEALAVFPKTIRNFETALGTLPPCAIVERKNDGFDSSVFTVVTVRNDCRK